MNRNTYLFFVRNFLFLLFLLLSTHSFGGTFYAMGNNVTFSSTSSWNSEADGSGSQPGTGFTTIGENFIIEGNKTINVTSNLTIGGLTLNSGATLKIIATTDVTITMDSLVINKSGGSAISIIDCGSNNVILIISGNLRGEAFSEIKHNPSTGKTQRLILRGGTNKLYKFSLPTTIPGTSIVRYEGANQDVFNAGPYSFLELTGNRPKTLLSPSTGAGEATVTDGLTISNSRLILNGNNFNYTGSDAKLDCTTGWIQTSTGGTYSSTHSESTRRFPVGNASNMMALSLTNIANTKVTVSFGSSATPVPNNGIDAWQVTPASKITTQITFIEAGNQSSLSPVSNIAILSGTTWKIQATSFTSPSYTTANNIILTNTPTTFGLFTCPAFNISPSVLPDATAGTSYNQTLAVSGGTSPYSLVSSTSTPSLYKLSGPTGTQNELKISGTAPSSSQAVTVSFVMKDATGCQRSLSAVVNTQLITIWNGSKWSGVTPDGKTANVRAIIAGIYSTAQYGNIKASDIIIQNNGILTISIGDTIAADDSIRNFGKFFAMCGSDKSGSFDGNAAEYLETVISPVSMSSGIAGQPYSQTFAVAGDPDASFTITNSTLPSGYQFNKTPNTLTFTAPTTLSTLSFNITYTKTGLTGCTTTQTQTIKIIAAPSPNLTILPIGPKTFGDANFAVRTYSRSTGTITYAITSTPSCATINTATGEISIDCAGPSPQHIVTVRATQTVSLPGTTPYKAETTTETFVIKPAEGRFIVRNNAFLLNQTGAINVFTRLPNPTFSFQQLTGADNATVQADGSITTHQVGEFKVQISMAATNYNTAFDSTFTFNVITVQKPPVAVADTIVLEMGKDTTFNIVDNDLGMTAEIAPNKTDIDIENNGIQIKFYSTELGNFLIDPQGYLTVLPFNGFIGSGRLGYSVADVNGLRSEIAYVEVIVKPPYVVPELKANNVMTPNNDNLNDALVIANTDLNKENTLSIIDQAGNTVYETTNYQNNWEGIDNKNNKLEPGVYFYIFKEKSSGREIKNYIQIVK